MDIPTVLVAPDSFKGTFTAEQVCEAVAAGVEAAGLRADRCPVADGGEGTTAILCRALGGERRQVTVSGPFGEPRRAGFAMVGADAYLDLAEASGIAGLTADQLDPIAATTTGTGALMLAARRAGARRIIVAAGGSATVDGGLGALQAIEDGGGLGDAQVVVLCDVVVPIERAAATFGPQKGATAEEVERLEARLDALAQRWPNDPRGLPMGGAAGGFSGGLWSVLGARLVPGADFVLSRLDFDRRLRRAKAVIVGEGGLDDQSFMGKIVGQIAERAHAAGRPIHAICGHSQLDLRQIEARGLASVREASTLDDIRKAARQAADR